MQEQQARSKIASPVIIPNFESQYTFSHHELIDLTNLEVRISALEERHGHGHEASPPIMQAVVARLKAVEIAVRDPEALVAQMVARVNKLCKVVRPPTSLSNDEDAGDG